MSKPLTFEIGKRERVFKFEEGSRKALLREFCGTTEIPGLYEWVYKLVLPLNEKGEPTMGGNWDHQVAFIHAALKHEGARVTRDKVDEWCDALVQNDIAIQVPVMVAIAAAWEQGLFGRRLSFRTEEEETPEAGKEQGDSNSSDSSS